MFHQLHWIFPNSFNRKPEERRRARRRANSVGCPWQTDARAFGLRLNELALRLGSRAYQLMNHPGLGTRWFTSRATGFEFENISAKVRGEDLIESNMEGD